MRVAIFHSFMDNIGGAEIVTLTLARALGADVYTTNVSEGHIRNMGFGDVLPRVKSIGRVPKKAPFRHQATLWRFRRLSLGKSYDRYVICGDWAMSAAVNHSPNLWYAHSPLNELWEFKDYVRDEIVKTRWKRPLFDLWAHMNRRITLRYAKSVGAWMCNSANTQDRIRRYYRKEAEIAYPPTDTKRFELPTAATNEKPGYWLSVNRIMRPKRIEIQMEALSLMPEERLVIVGSYERGAIQFEGYKEELDRICPSNVSIRSWVPQEELVALYAGAKGLLATALDEDFGMSTVEAMAAGKPVVASDKGGYRETVVNGETGLLVKDVDGRRLAAAMREVSDNLARDPGRYDRACRERAGNFDTEKFVEALRSRLQRQGPATNTTQ